MSSLDLLTYKLKGAFPAVYRFVHSAANIATSIRHWRRKRAAFAVAELGGAVCGDSAVVAPLSPGDADEVSRWFSNMSKAHLEYFRPHGFSRRQLRRIFRSPAYCCYGVRVQDRITAYALIKLFPTRVCYLGLIVTSAYKGMGIGKFLWRYMLWQAAQMRLSPRATIHEDNIASMKSLKSIRSNVQLHPLLGGYIQVKVPHAPVDDIKPELIL